jgi:hypothetical protein
VIRRRTPARVLACLTLLAVLGTLGVMGAEAQSSDPMQQAAAEVARAWASGGDRAVVAHLAGGRISLHLEGNVSAALPTRQAGVVLRDYLRGYESGEVEMGRVALVEGSSERGFAEIQWSARRVGTSQTLVRTIFLGLREESGSWLVDEVRVLP